MNRQIICNQIQTPDGTLLISYHTHDYKEYKDKISGEVYMVDGGMSYLRRNINKVPYTELSIYSDDPFEVIRENLYRGTFDKNEKRIYKKLSEMSNAHVANCIEYNIKRDLGNSMANEMYAKELVYREENKIVIED